MVFVIENKLVIIEVHYVACTFGSNAVCKATRLFRG